jgi:nucleoside phosphorylase
MAGMGKAAASQAASSVRSSYPKVKLALVVGVCGGVPSYSDGKEDLILGDVVISDGIVQYDFGRRFPDVFLSKSGPEVVSRPGPKLRGILAKLKGVRRRERLEAKLLEYLEDLQNTLGSMRVGYPGIDKDELYHEAYRHKHRNPSSCKICAHEDREDLMCEDAQVLTCQQVGCQKSRLVHRKRLLEASADGVIPKPRVHFGFVRSGDTVMKSGQHRDLTAAQHNLIAFEMEASGIWDNLPYLVIKGVCDYADSHKNKHWQYYAAATAAACMKAVLEEC